MWLGLHAFENEHEPEVGPVRHPYEIKLETAFREQTTIGWYQMLMGRMSFTWAEANRDIWTAEGRKMKLNDTTWTAKVVSSMWDYLLMIWLDQNEGVHGKLKTASELEMEPVMENVDKVYELVAQQLDPSDRWILNEPVETRKKSGMDTIVAWLENLKIMHSEKCEGLGIKSTDKTYTRDINYGTGVT